MDTIGDRIRWVRGQRGISRAALVKLSGVKYPTLAGIENNDQSATTQLHALAKALRTPAEYLATGRGPWDARAPAHADAQVDETTEIWIALSLTAQALAASIPSAGRALADALSAIPAAVRDQPHLRTLLDTLHSELSSHAAPPATRPAQESPRRKRR